MAFQQALIGLSQRHLAVRVIIKLARAQALAQLLGKIAAAAHAIPIAPEKAVFARAGAGEHLIIGALKAVAQLRVPRALANKRAAVAGVQDQQLLPGHRVQRVAQGIGGQVFLANPIRQHQQGLEGNAVVQAVRAKINQGNIVVIRLGKGLLHQLAQRLHAAYALTGADNGGVPADIGSQHIGHAAHVHLRGGGDVLVRKELVAAHQQRAEGNGILCVLRPCS